ncbi:fungal-specific transcription factor domain-containing protein [Lineolata rhizophorae]|uniref:Fungal-specific transcription factor domain-containing protein n=1 Tax=Lineolata rhizophorae TaxID=578093 RepID=A0A6A6P5M1_9PEZI|nr:fungal-specific transcription factor domain-containing protein [Lineolata rhizophorae]
MLSTSLHQYPPAFSHMQSPDMVNHNHHHQHMAPQHMPTPGLDSLAHSSHYALQQLHQPHQPFPHNRPFIKQRHHPYGNGPLNPAAAAQRNAMPTDQRPGRATAAAGPVRRRISRACDQCNQLRTKCDGKNPCAHCIEFGLTCEYVRERKKRGKASRKDIAAQQAAAAAAAAAANGTNGASENSNGVQSTPTNGVTSEDQNRAGTPQGIDRQSESRGSINDRPASSMAPRSASMSSTQTMNSHGIFNGMSATSRAVSMSGVEAIAENGMHPQMPNDASGRLQNGSSMMGMPDFASVDEYGRPVMPSNGQHMMHHNVSGPMPHPIIPPSSIQGYGESPYSMLSPQSQSGHPGFRLGTEESSLSGFLGSSPVAGSPGWLSLPSPSTTLYAPHHSMPASQALRYPVLQPILPHLGNLISTSLACDLLELYFQSSSSAFFQPLSPYVLGYVFRKRSFLRPNNPRVCSPALLASMLWIGAQTSESPVLTSSPSARGKICQKLLELTVGLLKPLIHTTSSDLGSPNYEANTVVNGVALGGFGVALPSRAQDAERGSPGAAGDLDDVATYMHLAIVVSASEYKAASLRWWNAAWSLARELKLCRELPTPNPSNRPAEPGDEDADGEVDLEMNVQNGSANGTSNTPGEISEEEREERRRIWWLLYIMDRHLALCYNRPLFLRDAECDGLLQPIDDNIWQSGEFYSGDAEPNSQLFRRKGPIFECTGHSIFGYFLPLMTILGEIVDLVLARNHPRFGLRIRSSDWDEQASEIREQLDSYGRSLREFEARSLNGHSDSKADLSSVMEGVRDHSSPSGGQFGKNTESLLHTKMVVAYGTHLMHTLHILLNGKWDPISLLDDNDLWISSPSFMDASSHAVAAAEALSDILEHDPDLSFMPFFFGIYLLQGSCLMLLIADKLQGEASPSIVKACETIVRAHEACVVTLNTEYQRNFRKVMRSALAQVRGRLLEDFGEQQLRRREVLSLYRWTGDGTGLAL